MVHLIQSQGGSVDLVKTIQSDKKCQIRSLLPLQMLCVTRIKCCNREIEQLLQS